MKLFYLQRSHIKCIYKSITVRELSVTNKKSEIEPKFKVAITSKSAPNDFDKFCLNAAYKN